MIDAAESHTHNPEASVSTGRSETLPCLPPSSTNQTIDHTQDHLPRDQDQEQVDLELWLGVVLGVCVDDLPRSPHGSSAANSGLSDLCPQPQLPRSLTSYLTPPYLCLS